MKIEFRIPISPTRAFYSQIRLYNYALRRLGPPYSQARLMVVVGDHCDIDGVRHENRWSDDYDIVWERVPDHISQEFDMWGTADWRFNAPPGNAEIIILSDADTVLLQDIAPLLAEFSNERDRDRAIVRGHMAHFPPPSAGDALPAGSSPDFWLELFSSLSIPWPETLHAYSMDGGTQLPRVPAYFNLGFVAMNGHALASFGERIVRHQRHLKALTKSHMSCQIAVTTMAYEAEMDIAPLPAMYNAANDLDHLAVNGLAIEDIRVLHYLRGDEIDRSSILLPEKIDEFLARTLTNPANVALQSLARDYRKTLELHRLLSPRRTGHPMTGLNSHYLPRDALESLKFQALGDNVLVHSTAVLVHCDKISLGSNVRIDPFVVISASGGVLIGRNCHLASHCCLSGRSEIVLGAFVGVSQGARLFSSTDDFKGNALTGPTVPPRFTNVHSAPLHLGRHVVIGAGCIVLPGAEVGEGVTVGALSLVNKPLDPWSIYAGVPARRLGERLRKPLELEVDYLSSISQSQAD